MDRPDNGIVLSKEIIAYTKVLFIKDHLFSSLKGSKFEVQEEAELYNRNSEKDDKTYIFIFLIRCFNSILRLQNYIFQISLEPFSIAIILVRLENTWQLTSLNKNYSKYPLKIIISDIGCPTWQWMFLRIRGFSDRWRKNIY